MPKSVNTPRTTASQYQIDVLDHLEHEPSCDWWAMGECRCDAGQMLFALLADERAEAAAQERKRIRGELVTHSGLYFLRAEHGDHALIDTAHVLAILDAADAAQPEGLDDMPDMTREGRDDQSNS